MWQDQPGMSRDGAQIDPRSLDPTGCTVDIPSQAAGGFGPGTLIVTDKSCVPVEWLAPGDLVLTRDNGYLPLVRVERRRILPEQFHRHPEDCPVRFPAGTLAPCAPERDLQVSGHHRLLVRAPNARQCAGQTEVLTPAHAWADLGLAEAFVPDQVYTFTHLFCAAHQIIHAQGAWVESGLPACPQLALRDGALERPDMTDEPRPTEEVEPARLCLQRREAHAVIHAERDSRFSSFPDTVLRRA